MDGWSFWSIVALWLGLSIGLWWVYRQSRARRLGREIVLARRAQAQVELAQGVFDTIRRVSRSLTTVPAGPSEPETHALLKRVQLAGAFFDEVNLLNSRVRHVNAGTECAPLAELLHIRRDLWAASEIVLMRDARMFGTDYADQKALDALRAEAVAVLFKDGRASGGAESDLIDLRLSLAREDATQFVADVAARVEAAREEDRLPSPREIGERVAASVHELPARLQTGRERARQSATYVLALARRIRESKGMVRGLAELRRARETLPVRVSAGAAGASALARRSAVELKRHYEFLAAAHDLQARYAQGMRKGSEVSDQARQFIARLDLAARSERLRLTSASAFEWAKRNAVLWIAKVIAALPNVQARLDEARADTARAVGERPIQPFVLRWPPDEHDDRREG